MSQKIVHINIRNINTNAAGFVLNVKNLYSSVKNRCTVPARHLALMKAASQVMSQVNVWTAVEGGISRPTGDYRYVNFVLFNLTATL